MQPDSIHGPVLLTAEDYKNEEYVQVGRGWRLLRASSLRELLFLRSGGPC